MSNSFWTEGPEKLRQALDERRAEVEELASRLRKATDPAERERLQAELTSVLEEYEPSPDELDRSLFLLG